MRKMLENWHNWCRLCAKIESKDADKMYKADSTGDQLEIVNKNFMISLLPFEGIHLSVCLECCSFLTKVDTFRDRCLRTDQMFKELKNLERISDSDLESIRFKYGVGSEELKYSAILSDVQSEDTLKEENISNSPCLDPLDMPIENAVVVKLEEPETVAVSVPKKRGRPKKIIQPTNLPRLKVKRETECTDDESGSQEIDTTLEIKTTDHEDDPPRKRKRIWKGPREKKHFCSICPKKFNRPHLLREHIIEEHRQEEMRYVCSACSKRFSCEKKLKVHEISHLPVSEGLIHPCPHCDKKFNHKYKIPSHIRAMHTGDKPFVCEECGNSFKTKSALNAHQVSHVEERLFQCSNCPKKFKNQRALKRHDEDTHQDTVHECPHCDVKLKNRRTFRSHLLVHSDVKKYKCNYCGSEFKRRKTFKDHLILHTGQRPYECPFCDKTFANGSNCTSHKKKAHPVELAALEASGERPKMAVLPRLEHLQPKQSVPECSTLVHRSDNCEKPRKVGLAVYQEVH